MRPPRSSTLWRGTTWLLPAAGLVFVAGLALAQSGLDMNDLVIDWSRGRFASPVHCDMGGETIRGIRRVLITPKLARDRRGVAEVQFQDMQVEGASRCFDTLGHPIPNAIGKLQLRVDGPSRPDSASRDFRLALKRDRGFTLRIIEGALKLQAVTDPPTEPRIVDFRGGEAQIHEVLPATDAGLELAEFASPRKALLEVKAKTGETLSLPIFLTDPR